MLVIKNESPTTAEVPKRIIYKKFVSDFSVLYETKKGSDVILVAGNQEFNAHKAILMARSDVFAAMFDNQMRENIENKVEIKDIEPQVLEVILLFIYTGEVKDMDKIGAQLMTAADKYGLDQLKTICSRHLITNICANTAIETLILSKFMNDSNMKRSALELIRANLIVLVKTKDWTNLKTNNSELLDEIVLFSIKNQSIEAKICWNFTEISELKNNQKSEITEIHGLPWRIKAHRHKRTKLIEGQQSITKYLGVYLLCDKKVDINSDFSCYIRGDIKLVSQKEGITDIIKDISGFYSKDSMYWGYAKLYPWEKLLDPNNGYIKNDTIILEAIIIVDPPKGVPTSEDIGSETEEDSSTDEMDSDEDDSSDEE